MKFEKEKKRSIVFYILEKISEPENNTDSKNCLSKSVADATGVSQTTICNYLKELVSENIIRKSKRGEYKLISRRYRYKLERNHGDLDSDMHAFEACLLPHINTFPQNVQGIWQYAFTEMVNNVIDHSEAETMYVDILQNYLTTSVIIADNGVGIFEKIKNHFHFSDTDEAIGELFKGKLTTDAQNHSGEGIFFTSKMMDTFFIYSKKKIFATTKYSEEGIFTPEETAPGTFVVMSLSNFSHKTAKEIFDQYADVDGGFTKTTIPLKNYFDTAPVSRSQAKRVCYRLNEFEEVILDFQDVSWMGQGFAHQLFVVFQKAHPKIRLTPVHMNEAVEKMYRHVVASGVEQDCPDKNN